MVQLGFDFRLTILFELIIMLIWIDSWTAEHMTSKKTSIGIRHDMEWQHGIDIDKNSREIQCKYCQKILSWGIYNFKHHLVCTRKEVKLC
jgi:hypothetical protein